jgi:hypothetical protein
MVKTFGELKEKTTYKVKRVAAPQREGILSGFDKEEFYDALGSHADKLKEKAYSGDLEAKKQLKYLYESGFKI